MFAGHLDFDSARDLDDARVLLYALDLEHRLRHPRSLPEAKIFGGDSKVTGHEGKFGGRLHRIVTH